MFPAMGPASELRRLGVNQCDVDRCVLWWLIAPPGETMMLVRYGARNLIVGADGSVRKQPRCRWFTRTSS